MYNNYDVRIYLIQHSGHNLSIEEKTEVFKIKLKDYRNKCQTLEKEKQSLKEEKHMLKMEVSRLKEQVETASIASHVSALSNQKGVYYSCSSLYERDSVSVSDLSSYIYKICKYCTYKWYNSLVHI